MQYKKKKVDNLEEVLKKKRYVDFTMLKRQIISNQRDMCILFVFLDKKVVMDEIFLALIY